MILRAGMASFIVGLLIAGCGGSSSQQPVGAGGALGAPIRLADCSDWENGSVDKRLAAIRELDSFAAQPVSGAQGAQQKTLDDDQAYDLFEHWCGNGFATGFKLYKLYFRASALANLQQTPTSPSK